MTRPDAIPVLGSSSRVILDPAAIAALFGEPYRCRGSERVRVVGPGRADVVIQALPGSPQALYLDGVDAAILDGRPSRLVGPRGSLAAPPPQRLRRELVLPRALLRSWNLRTDDRVAVQLGSVVFTDIVVVEGAPAGVTLDRADLAAADADEAARGHLRRDVAAGAISETAPAGARRVLGRLITENDVRQARLRGQRISVQPGQKLTPAARSLGRELGILDDEDGRRAGS